MKILMLSNMYPNEEFPSYGVFVKNFETIIKELDYKMEKVVITKTTNKWIKIMKYIKYNFQAIIKMILNNYDVIYIHYASNTSIPVILVSKFKKIKIYTNVHGTDILPQNNKQEKMQKYVQKILKISDKVIVPSKYYKSVVEKKYSLNKEKIFIFPSGGVNEKIFNNMENKEQLKIKYGFKKNDKICGYISRIDNKKGWEVLIEAIKRLDEKKLAKDYKFLFVGTGAQEELLKKEISTLKNKENVIYIPAKPQNELAEIYNILDFFCYPTFQESLGLVAIESLISGVPVIASEISPLTEYIEDGVNGLLFQKGDGKNLAKKIEYFINLEEKEKNILKENALIFSEKYKRKHVKKTLNNILIEG